MTASQLYWVEGDAPRSSWSPAAASLATLAILIASLAGACGVVWLGTMGYGILSGTGAQLPAVGTAQSHYLLFAVILLFQALVAGLALVVAGLHGGERWRLLGLDRLPSGRDALLGLAGMAALLLPYNGLVYLIDPASFLRDLAPFAKELQTGTRWLMLPAVSLGAPLSEEMLFRGFLLAALAPSRLGFRWAVVVVAAAWCALHMGYSIYGLGEVFMIGLYFGWLMWRTGSLWLTIGLHALYNTLLQVILLLLWR